MAAIIRDTVQQTVCDQTGEADVAEPQKIDSASKVKGSAAKNMRWGVALALTVLSSTVLLADLVTFGSRAGEWAAMMFDLVHVWNFRAELTALISISVLFLLRSVTPEKQTSKGKGEARSVPAAKGTRRPQEKARSSAPGRAGHHAAAWGDAGSSGAAPATSVVSKWNKAIDLAARQGDLKRAEQLLQELCGEASEVQPDAVSFNLVIRAHAKKGDVAAAEGWLRRMEASRVRATVCSYNTLLDACTKANKAEVCEQWLNHMLKNNIEANVISYATAIYARARRGDMVAAEGWLRRMLADGIQPDAVSYNSLIHACSIKGAAQKAEQMLEEMQSHGLEATVATYTAVIDACAKAGDVDRAEAWFERMLEAKVEPNVITFSAMIDACAKAGNLSRAEHWHGRMQDHGIAPNAHSYTALINACARRTAPGGAEAAERWLDRSEEAGVVNDVVVYSSVIDACGKAGDAERGLRVFRRMQAQGLKPHVVAYAALARPYAYRGDWIKVESIAQELEADKIAINEYFIYAQLLAYAVARPRQAQRAEVCFRAALKAGVQANDHIVGVLARAVGRPRAVELMAELCGGREVPVPPARKEGGRQQSRR